MDSVEGLLPSISSLLLSFFKEIKHLAGGNWSAAL